MRTRVITVPLSDEQARALAVIAASRGISPEALLQIAVDDFLKQSDEEFAALVDYVLEKNTELYRRLA